MNCGWIRLTHLAKNRSHYITSTHCRSFVFDMSLFTMLSHRINVKTSEQAKDI